ncbi:hypothetical protein ACKKBG_A07420 [Auxenochlorella protothecoides x Auxenochlorella symbiontica]
MVEEGGIALFARPPSKLKTRPRKEDNALPKTVTRPAAVSVPPSGAKAGEDDTATFRSLGLSDWMAGVCRGLGMPSPTAVQRACIPAILAGRDVIAVSQTGTGKTAAFALPILQLLARDPFGVFALVLTPTRELALQLADHFRALGSGGALRDAVIIGGVDGQAQARALTQRPHLVVATPGRLAGLLAQDPGLAACLARVRCLVLDEADRMLDASFEPELATVLAALPEERQTLLFSATMTRTLVGLQRDLLRDAFFYEAYAGLQTAARLREEYMLLPQKVKEVYLVYLLEQLEALKLRSAIVFVSTRRNCSLLQHLLAELGIKAAALHSGLPQRDRVAALDRFRAGVVPVLLATDVAARGLDIPDVDLVVNYDLPHLARDYVHRVGRTARAGRAGWSLSFVTQYDVELVRAIEGLLGRQLAAFEAPEKEVLAGITKVYAARRMAALRLAEEEDAAGATGQRRKKTRPAEAEAERPKGRPGGERTPKTATIAWEEV